MNSHVTAPSWTTSSYGDAADTSPMELSALGKHLDLCNGSRGHLFTLQCVAEAMNSLAAPRFVTTAVVTALLIGIGSWLV